MTSAALLARRLRWNRAVGEDPRPQPVVVLLGPVGSGKSSTLNSMAADCGDAVVHAKIDFSHDEPGSTPPASTVEALTLIADRLARKWPARHGSRFPRFALGLIAARARLDHASRESDRETLRAVIRDFARNPREDRVPVAVPDLVEAAEQGDVVSGALASALRRTLPRLIRTVGLRPLSSGKRWHEDIDGAEGGTPLDALVSLNEKATADPGSITAWLTAAFLADVRDNHPRMAKPDPGSPCVCDEHDRRPHWHNWVLLLDNLDHGIGEQFLNDLRTARDRHLRRKPQDHDPLLVIAASGRWNYDWGAEWRPLWMPEPETPDRVRTVVRCRDAGYWHWRGDASSDASPPRHYPVLIEPLGIDETARILGVSESADQSVFTQRATRGLPAAVNLLAPFLRGRELRAGARDVLSRLGQPAAPAREDLWIERIADLRLTGHLQDMDVREFVTAAAYATAPWLMPSDAEGFLRRPVGRILTELRTALWVIAPRDSRGVANHTELHPWIARTLSSALAARPADSARGYTEQFETLLADADIVRDPVRQMYCQLALGWFADVVDFFRNAFDQMPHQEWIDQLEMVTKAPDNLPLDRDRRTLFRELIEEWNRNHPDDRSPVGNVVSRLVAAMWLAANPFAVPDSAQQSIIVNAYRELVPLSRRADVGALYSAALRATEARL